MAREYLVTMGPSGLIVPELDDCKNLFMVLVRDERALTDRFLVMPNSCVVAVSPEKQVSDREMIGHGLLTPDSPLLEVQRIVRINLLCSSPTASPCPGEALFQSEPSSKTSGRLTVLPQVVLLRPQGFLQRQQPNRQDGPDAVRWGT
jgi:hypothetical protein